MEKKIRRALWLHLSTCIYFPTSRRSPPPPSAQALSSQQDQTTPISPGEPEALQRARYLSGHLRSLLVPPVEDLLVFVHPDLGQADLVPGDDLGAFGEGVGALGTEDVTHHGTRDDLDLTPALPDLRGGDA